MSGEELLLWGLGLLAGALFLVVVDLFVPSGGLISVLAAICAIAGVVCLFRVSTTWGAIGLLLIVVLGPAAFAFALRIWPYTPMGRMLILGGEKTEDQQAAEKLKEMKDRQLQQALVGTEASVVVDLRPVGKIELDGERVEAKSELGTIVPAGTRVKVVGIVDNQLRVRPIV